MGMDGGVRIVKIEDVKQNWTTIKENLINWSIPQNYEYEWNIPTLNELHEVCKKLSDYISDLDYIEVGKNWFYSEIEKDYYLYKYEGWQIAMFRQEYGFKKNKDKSKVDFYTHAVDSWTLANQIILGDLPDNKRVLHFKPLVYHRRHLHMFCPTKGDIRRVDGGTMSLGLKKGTLVKHFKYGLCLIGGNLKGRLSLHDLHTNKRLAQNAKKEDLLILTNFKFNVN